MRIALPYLVWGRSATSDIPAILGLERFVCVCVFLGGTCSDNALSCTSLIVWTL